MLSLSFWKHTTVTTAGFLYMPYAPADAQLKVSQQCNSHQATYMVINGSFYHAIHYSAKRSLAISCHPSVRPSVTLVDCDHIGWKSWKLIVQTTSPTSSVFVAQRSSTYSQGKKWEILWRLEVGWEKSGMLEHRSSNISETHKDRGKVTMKGLYELTNTLLDGIIPNPYGPLP